MADTISVQGYSSDNRVPGFYFALDASKANTASVKRRVLLIGQMTDLGTAKPNKAMECAGVSSAQALYGTGSQIALMVDAYRSIDRNGELWVLPLADDVGSIKASGSLLLIGTASQAGKVSFYIGDKLIEQPVNNGDTAAIIAQSFVDRINSLTSVPVVAVAKDSTVSITAKNAGECGNAIMLNINILGEIAGQKLPSGITTTITKMTGGVGTPSTLQDALSGFGNRQFDLFIHPFADTNSLASFTDLLNDQSGRWQITDQLFGHSITAFQGTYGEASALGNTINDQHTTIMPTSDSPTHPMIWAAQIGAQVAISMRDNPAIPIKGLILKVLPPSDEGTFIFSQRNSLLYDGMSTFAIDDGNQVRIERLITTYKRNSDGNDDDSYLNIETVLTASTVLQDMTSFLSSQFPRYILLADGAKITAGQQATTAELIGKSCVARYRTQAGNLWVQDPDAFSQEIIAENAGNGTVKLLLPYRFSDQLFVIAGNCQFVKSQGGA